MSAIKIEENNDSNNNTSSNNIIKLEDDDVVMQIDDDGTDDEVVREMDVYISPELSEQMYLLQFPLQDSRSNAVPQLPAEARIKKKHNLLELEHTIPYPQIGAEGNYSFVTRKQISHTIPVHTHLALGKIAEDGSMHLVPLSHLTQMRPDFTHVNLAQDDTTMEEPEDTNNSRATEKKPLLFQKKESERAAMIRKSSYAYKKASEDEEEWQDLIICGSQTPEYTQCQQSVLKKGVGSPQKSIATTSSEKNFVKTLNYLPGRAYDDAGAASDERMEQGGTTSDEQEQQESSPLVPVVTKCTKLLSRGVPVPFSVIRLSFPNSTVDDADLIQALSSCAVLVRGNFYLQSRLLFDNPDLIKARTFILYLLQTDGQLQRKGIDAVFESNSSVVTSEWIGQILQVVALRRRYGWTARLTDNLTFLALFPEQTQLHEQYWERVGTKFKDQLDIYRSGILE